MDYPYAPRLDSKVVVTGVYDAGSGTTSFTMPSPDGTLNAIVLGNAFGASAGRWLTPLPSSTQDTLYVPGQFDTGPVIIGRRYGMSVELSRPYRRDRGGRAIITDRLHIIRIQTAHRNSGRYTLRASMPNRTDREREFVPPGDALIDEQGHLRAMLNGDTKNMRVFLEANSPIPVEVASIEYAVEVSPGAGA